MLSSILSVTLSTGDVYVLKLSTDFTNIQLIPNDEPLITHNLEAWCSAFSHSISEIHGKEQYAIYSGGDDGHINVASFVLDSPSDPSGNEENDDLEYQLELQRAGLVRNARPVHDAGVTAILPLPFKTDQTRDILITGSYDDHVRVCAINPWGQSQGAKRLTVLSDLYIGGGVWRLKFVEQYEACTQEDLPSSIKVLASCMHAGARILEINPNESWSIKILGEVTDHKSMCYGSDVQPRHKTLGAAEEKSRLCVSTSFYDRLLCGWKVE